MNAQPELIKARERLLARIGEAMASEPEFFKGGEDLKRILGTEINDESEATHKALELRDWMLEQPSDKLIDMYETLYFVQAGLYMLMCGIKGAAHTVRIREVHGN